MEYTPVKRGSKISCGSRCGSAIFKELRPNPNVFAVIDKALSFLTDEINAYLEFNVGSEYNDTVKLSAIVGQDGSSVKDTDNSLILSLVNIEEDRILKSQLPTVEKINGQVAKINPEVKLNLYLLFTANFNNYKESLKFLSHIVSFFQINNVFTPGSHPTLDPAVRKLIVDMHTVSFEQQNNLWGSIGAKYMPSVMYKLRLIVIREAVISKRSDAISEPVISTNK